MILTRNLGLPVVYFSLWQATEKTFTITQARHNKSIDDYLDVILVQILSQAANESNRQHSLFACFIN